MGNHCVKFKAGGRKQYKRYIKMCEKASEIQEDHYIVEGDCVFNEKEGVFEAARIRNEIITSTPDRAVNCSIYDCKWLPALEDLVELAEVINLTPESLEIFLTDTTGTFIYRPTPGVWFRMPEEQWLAYYMIERYQKIWIISEEQWKKFKKMTVQR